MARTRSRQYPANQNLILDRAAELFARLGFHGATIAELAQACNFSKASLYHYYDSKEQILFELLHQHLNEMAELADQAISSSTDPMQQFRNFITENMKFYVHKVNHHIVLNRDMRYLPEPLYTQIRNQERDLLQRMTRLLEKIKPELKQSPGCEKVYAMLFFGMLNWTYTWYDPEGQIDVEHLAAMVMDLYLNGFTHIQIPGK